MARNVNSRIFIDGKETRKRIDEMVGKPRGTREICRGKDIRPNVINESCLRGYITPETLNKCIKAGIPIVTSNKPIPDRRQAKWTKKDKIIPNSEEIIPNCDSDSHQVTMYEIDRMPDPFPSIPVSLETEMLKIMISKLQETVSDMEKLLKKKEAQDGQI